MLKIKDNVDLKELEKFGLEYSCGYNYKEYRLFEIEQIVVDCKTREIGLEDTSVYDIVTDKPLNILFDLIKADLVEKVVEE